MDMNHSLFFFLHNLAHQSPGVDSLVIFTAVWLGDLLILASVLFLLLHSHVGIEGRTFSSFKQKMKEIFVVLGCAFTAWVVTWLLKHSIGSLRPFDMFADVTPLFPETGFAFPSNHATFFSALAVLMFLYHKKFGIILGIGALLIGIARVIGGVHFPLDILGGFIVGPIVALLAYRMLRWFGRKYNLIY